MLEVAFAALTRARVRLSQRTPRHGGTRKFSQSARPVVG